jgi:hypothetical protein
VQLGSRGLQAASEVQTLAVQLTGAQMEELEHACAAAAAMAIGVDRRGSSSKGRQEGLRLFVCSHHIALDASFLLQAGWCLCWLSRVRL